jgi:hypothetical protein
MKNLKWMAVGKRCVALAGPPSPLHDKTRFNRFPRPQALPKGGSSAFFSQPRAADGRFIRYLRRARDHLACGWLRG